MKARGLTWRPLNSTLWSLGKIAASQRWQRLKDSSVSKMAESQVCLKGWDNHSCPVFFQLLAIWMEGRSAGCLLTDLLLWLLSCIHRQSWSLLRQGMPVYCSMPPRVFSAGLRSSHVFVLHPSVALSGDKLVINFTLVYLPKWKFNRK